MGKESYVLITPARNEEAYIEKTIESVIFQTILPKKWVIVSNASTDRTDEIVNRYVATHDFIQLLRTVGDANRNFSSKVNAINIGYSQLENVQYDFIGILDADVSFAPYYYEKILAYFETNLRLGITGGNVIDLYDGKHHQVLTSPNSVRGAVQFFRKKCYREIGGFLPLNRGEDTVAEVMARMHGWEVRSFPTPMVLHHRRTGTGGSSIWLTRFHEGRSEYRLGYHPLFHIAKTFRRIAERPYLLGSVLRAYGYLWSMLHQDKYLVPDDFVKYIRREQIERLISVFSVLRSVAH
jgi:biofilm PGA synthesis N-glycosyltransferase PgaC